MLSLVLVLSCAGFALAADIAEETVIVLSDSGVTVDGQAASTDASDDVYTGADIIYYEEGHDSTYGEGTAADAHSADEAAAHTVVTIAKAGTYRISGTLSAGQIAVDLGESAADDPEARVTLILDGLDITSTVAPAVIFYNVYEPYSSSEDTKGVTDLTDAGAQVILADDSVNKVQGAYVARIYKPGTTKKLHKYDGAFYSRMSMNISGEVNGTGELHINAENEGLDSELHLTLNSGKIYISSQDDGINTNEDNISVTTINGGTLYINAGLGAEGDGIDSNGYLTINGGTIITMSNETSPDGGIDADGDITINGGTLIALGTRNDAVSTASEQLYMELSFASTQSKGSTLLIQDASGNVLLEHTVEKAFQSLTFSSADLALNTAYRVHVNGVQQQYTGNASGMMGGFPGGSPPEGEQPGGALPNGFDPAQAPDRPDGMTPPDNEQNPGEGRTPGQRPANAEDAAPGQRPNSAEGEFPGTGNQGGENAEGAVDFILTANVRSFSGVSDASDASGKTRVSFTVNQGRGITNTASGEAIVLTDITPSLDVPAEDIQITITDVPSEDYAESAFLSEGIEALRDILPTADGTYQLTVAVASANTQYTGVAQWQFTIGALPFTDINPRDSYYNAVKALYDQGIMVGTSDTAFSPDEPVTRAMAITVLARLLDVTVQETDAFSDVPAGTWYSGYVGWAASNEIVVGDGTGRFAPNDSLTAAHLDLILSRYAAIAGIEYTSSAGADHTVTRGELAEILVELLQ